MRKIKKNIGKIIWTSIAVAIVFFVLVISVIDDGQYVLRQVEAGSEHNISGYAWSDNIGWISCNCTDADTCEIANYGVNIATNGNISGYAWSDNIGWISFNESDLSDCPVPNDDGECKAKLTGNHLNGWAKVLAGEEETADGWDGWISLGTQIGETVDYGVDLVGDNFEGYAWGDEVVGWIQFNPAYGGVVCEGGTVVIDSFYVNNIQTGYKPTASFTTENANKCKGDWVAGNICSSVEECASMNFTIDQLMPVGGTTYTLTCYGLGGTASESVSPAVYFELIGNPATMEAVFSGGGATTTPINISAVSMNGFNGNITLSADLGSLPADSVAIFSDTVLAFSEYGAGSELKIYIPEPISGLYDIEITGNGQDVSTTLNITINATGITPVFEEI